MENITAIWPGWQSAASQPDVVHYAITQAIAWAFS